MKKLVKVPLLIALVLSVILMLAACSTASPSPENVAPTPSPEEPNPTEPTPETPEPVKGTSANLAALNLPAWSAYADNKEDTDKPVPIGSIRMIDEAFNNLDYGCTVQEFSMTKTPKEIVMLNPTDGLWVGQLLQGKDIRRGVISPVALNGDKRMPLTISLNQAVADVSRTISSPQRSVYRQALGELIENAKDNGAKFAPKSSFDQSEAYSLDQAMLEMGVSASFIGTDIQGKLGVDNKATQNTIMAYFVQAMYTVDVDLPEKASDFFSDGFTQDDLDRLVQQGTLRAENPPVYVSSITYGRILAFSLTSTESTSKLTAAISAANEALEADAEISAETLRVLRSAEIRHTTVGGSSEGVDGLIQTGQLSKYFEVSPELTEYAPIAFRVNNLADNSLAEMSETTTFSTKTCAQKPTGGEYNLQLDALTLTGECDIYDGDKNVAHVYYDFSLNGDLLSKVVAGEDKSLRMGQRHRLVGTNGTGSAKKSKTFKIKKGEGAVMGLKYRIFDRDASVFDRDDTLANRTEEFRPGSDEDLQKLLSRAHEATTKVATDRYEIKVTSTVDDNKRCTTNVEVSMTVKPTYD